jgi:hypothetical protein
MTDKSSMIDGKAVWQRLENRANTMFTRDEVDCGILQGIYYAQECIESAMKDAGLDVGENSHTSIASKNVTSFVNIGKRIERVIRKNSYEWSEYLSARFQAPKSDTFIWEGHRWKYRLSHFDDVGEFDIIFRYEKELAAA